jgi:hypothetical protein
MRITTRSIAIAIVLGLPILALAGERPADKLVVHEWGTFTALQDETGRAIGGINVNDEPLPVFVHRIGPGVVNDDNGGKGLSVGLPDVTMRLETPVIYFYPPASGDKVSTVDVSATFNGGLLTEFYPNSQLMIDGKPATQPSERITESLRGGVTWKNVTIGTNDPMPLTNSHVWVSPRNVDSSPIEVGKEAEQYIFYRGCGHIEAPLRVRRDGDRLSLFAQYPSSGGAERRLWNPLVLPDMWLAEFRADGTCAFREMSYERPKEESGIAVRDGSFAGADFSGANIAALKKSMRAALIKNGLFEKEADAMLETWRLSYFGSAGQRLFFIVPRQWTDAVLPLTISKPCELTRVMMGRIELITPSQRQAINQLLTADRTKPKVDVKATFASLGRFGYAMIQDERQRKEDAAKSPMKRSRGF